MSRVWLWPGQDVLYTSRPGSIPGARTEVQT